MPSRDAVLSEVARLTALGYPCPATDKKGLDLLAGAWLDAFADLSDAELAAACRRYTRSTDPADRWWPTPGRLLACADVGMAAGQLGTEGDAEAAFAAWERKAAWFIGHNRCPDRDAPAGQIDAEIYRNDAMFFALDALGGWDAWRRGPTAENGPGYGRVKRIWCDAYRRARGQQRHDPAAARAIVGREQGRIGVGS